MLILSLSGADPGFRFGGGRKEGRLSTEGARIEKPHVPNGGEV